MASQCLQQNSSLDEKWTIREMISMGYNFFYLVRNLAEINI